MRYPIKTAVTVSAIVVGFLIVERFSIRSRAMWMDPVTGSIKSQRFLVSVGLKPVVDCSALEEWIIRHEGSYSPSWQFLSRSSDDFVGAFRACGFAPPIYGLHSGFSKVMVEHSSDQELAEFVRIMRTGSKEEQKAAVDAMTQKIFSPGR